MKTAIVAEGGASRAYYTVGIMDALTEFNIYPDYFIGVSAGIANGVSYISRQFGRNLEIAEKYCPQKEYMGISHLIKDGNYYNIDYVFNTIPNKLLPFDYNTYYSFKGDIYCAVTNVKTGKCEYLRINNSSNNWKELVASCALPIMFKPVELNGNLYLDGGITNSIPYQKALNDGCDRVLVLLTRDRRYIKKTDLPTRAASFAYKKYPEFSKALLNRADMYNNQRKDLFKLEKQGKVKIICPDDTSSWKRISKDARYTKNIYNIGYNYTKNHIDEIKDYFGV